MKRRTSIAQATLAACGETHAAFDRRCIPPEPRRFAALCVAFRSKYTRYSSLTRLVSRAPHRSRRSRGFHHRLLAALSLLVLAACGPTTTGSSGPTNPEVDAIFADLRGDRPGAAVGVRWNGEVVHRAGYGTAHLDHAVPITPETVFDIASISKQFGAMAALLLESEGNLDLDADVRGYVPELPDFGAVITARHLIHHTSGIRDWPHTMALGGIGFTDVISFEKILRMLYHQQAINFPPGSEYAYSNTAYNLLARVIEVQSGMTFREYTESRIFAPLGMTRTHFSDDSLEVVPGRAESYAKVAEWRGLPADAQPAHRAGFLVAAHHHRRLHPLDAQL